MSRIVKREWVVGMDVDTLKTAVEGLQEGSRRNWTAAMWMVTN